MSNSKQYQIIRKGIGEIELEFYPKKVWFNIIFMIVWLYGWLFGEILVISTLFFENISVSNTIENESSAFMVLWLIAWTVGGIFVYITLIWMVFGKEEIIIDRQELVIQRVLGFYKRKRKYELEHIKELRIKMEKQDFLKKRKNSKTVFSDYGNLRFNYHNEEVKFGLDIKASDAGVVLSEIKDISRFTNLSIE